MTYPIEKFTQDNIKKAFGKIVRDDAWEYVRYSLLLRYAQAKKSFVSTDRAVVDRAIAIADTIEQILADFGEPLYGGLPEPTVTTAQTSGFEEFGLDGIGGATPRGTGL